MTTTGNSCFCMADLKKSSPLKPLGQMNRNLVGSIDNGKSYLSFNSLGKSYLSFNSLGKSYLSFNRRRFFRNQPIRNKNCLWRSCLLTDRDKMSNLYRGPSIDASYQVSCNMFVLYITSRYSHFYIRFSKPCQRQYELLSSLGVCRLYEEASLKKSGSSLLNSARKQWCQCLRNIKIRQKLILSLARFAKTNIKMWIPTCNV
jgi:hypothetical protein